MPPNTVSVTRPGRWGNPFPVDHEGVAAHAMSMGLSPDDEKDRTTASLDLFKMWIVGEGKINELVWALLPKVKRAPPLRIIQRDLAGKDLACFCALDHPCHADVLLKIANQSTD